MHSRRFTDEKGGFYLHNKRAGKTYYSNPKAAFAETHLYTKEDVDGAKDTSLETRFSEIKGAANTVMGKIVEAVRQGKDPILSEDERADWDTYLYMQWKRTPNALAKVATLQEADARLTELFAQIAARGPDAAAEVAKLDTAEKRKRMIQGSKVQAIDRVPGEVLKVFASRGILILHIVDPNLRFAIGSLPVVRKRRSLHEATAEVWLPVAPDVAVGIGGLPGAIGVLKIDNAEAVRAVNQVTAAQSTSFASASKELVDELAAFVAGLPKRNTPESDQT